MHLKDLFHHAPSAGRHTGVTVYTKSAKKSDLQDGDVILQPGSTVNLTAGGVKYTVDEINDEYRCTVRGGKFADGQHARLVGAGANIAFRQGASVKFDGCVIRSEPAPDGNIRPAAELSLTTGPVESLFIDGEQIF